MKDQFTQNWSEKTKIIPFDSKLSILKDHYGYSNYLDKNITKKQEMSLLGYVSVTVYLMLPWEDLKIII